MLSGPRQFSGFAAVPMPAERATGQYTMILALLIPFSNSSKKPLSAPFFAIWTDLYHQYVSSSASIPKPQVVHEIATKPVIICCHRSFEPPALL